MKNASVARKTDGQIVFGFDFGTSGFAAAIRHENKIVWARSEILGEEFASTKDSAKRRRLWRTRQAHRAREYAWNQLPYLVVFRCLKISLKIKMVTTA